MKESLRYATNKRSFPCCWNKMTERGRRAFDQSHHSVLPSSIRSAQGENRKDQQT